MSKRSRPAFRGGVAAAALMLSVGAMAAAQASPENEWRIDSAAVSAVPFISQFVGGQWVQRLPATNGTLLEVRGILKVEGDGAFGPLRLSEVGLLSGTSGVPAAAELIAVGVGSVSCKYLPAQLGTGGPTEVKLGAGKEFTLLRDAATGSVLLRTRAPTLDLCMAFEVVGTPPPALLWSVARRPISLTVGSLARTAPAVPATRGAAPVSVVPAPVSVTPAQTGAAAVSLPMLWGALAGAAALALVATIVLLVRRRRQRETSDAAPAATRDGRLPFSIARVTPAHLPSSFARVEADGGPGQALFREALASIRLGEWVRADQLFGEAIDTGLTPTFEAGAWSLRGEARLNDNQLIAALDCFLRSLSCRAVTSESALVSANHLAAIYRELRLRRDASKMEKLRVRVSPFASELSPERVELIVRLATEFKRQRRAAVLSRLLPFR